MVWDHVYAGSNPANQTMASKVILDMMDDIIADMESKTDEELFNDLYNGSSTFRECWNKAVENEGVLVFENDYEQQEDDTVKLVPTFIKRKW